MLLDLRDILTDPGGVVPFDFNMDMSEFHFATVKEFSTPVHVTGRVENHAGTLTLSGRLSAEMVCVCARCLREFPRHLGLGIRAFLAEKLEDEDNVDYYLLQDGCADLEEIAATAVILNMEQRFLCKEDCKGLCPKCGKDLNDGPCSCGADRDQRLAVLGQLLKQD